MSNFHRIFISLMAIFLVNTSRAERFTIPNGLNGQLVFQNTTTESIEVYQKFPIEMDPVSFDPSDSHQWETSFFVKPGGSLHRETNPMVRPLQFESAGSGLKVWIKTDQGEKFEIPAGASTRLSLGPLLSKADSLITITNFSSQSQDGQILSRSLTGRPGASESFQLKAYQSVQVPFRQTSGSSLEINGQYSLGAILSLEGKNHIFRQKISRFMKADNPGALFLLANESRSQSYMVRLNDPALIEQAREQIKNPTGWRPRILVGQVSAGSNRDNQNLLGPFKPMWSWHVSKVFRFAELASQGCDGSPQFIEDVLPAWLGGAFNGGSTTICFWGYQIVEEL